MRQGKCFSLLLIFVFLSQTLALIQEMPLPKTLEVCRTKHLSEDRVTTVESMDTYCIRHHKMLLDRPYLKNMNITEETTNWIGELMRMSEMDHHAEVQYQRFKRQAVLDVSLSQNSNSMQYQNEPSSFQTSNQNINWVPIDNQASNFQSVSNQVSGLQQSNQQPFQTNSGQGRIMEGQGQQFNLQSNQQNLFASSSGDPMFQQENSFFDTSNPQNSQQTGFNQQGFNQQSFQQPQQLNQFPQQTQFVQTQQQQQQQQQIPGQQLPSSGNQQVFVPTLNAQPQNQQQTSRLGQNPSTEQFITQSRNENFGSVRVRKEYRMLTDQERNDFHRAVNMLKTDTSVQPNRYDALALVHFRLTNNIHHGSAFLPWHRTFITIFENALRQKVPTVTLPYFDSTMDEALLDPTLSIMWSPDFMGNGDGLVTTGPFAYWQTPSGPLIRNLGAAGGSLLSRDEIFAILSRARLQEISEPNAPDMFNFENYHGDVHTWLGGEMEPMETSAFDPIFYLHHCFIDYVWEIFQNRQRTLGIDPSTDYPQDPGGPTHSLQARMGFGDLRNAFGLGDFFTKEVYTYERNPSCSVNNPSCGSRYLTCDMSQGIAQCLPLSMRVNNAASVSSRQQFQGNVAVPPNPAFGSTPITRFAAPAPVFGKRKKRNTRMNPAGAINATEDTYTVNAQTSSCAASWLSFSSQNTFEVNGESDTRRWVFIPIKVINKRSPEHRKFQAFPIYNGQASRSRDIYNPDSYPEISPFFSEAIMPTSRICNHRESDRTVGKIHIESNGLNYHGNYDEYVVVDLRQALTESTTYIAMKDPKETQTEVLITAYDTCGRRCRAYCRHTDRKSGKTGYRACTGAIRGTDELPRMYGKNYGDAVRTSWSLQNLEDIPELKSESVFLQFYCDHVDG